MVFLRLFCSTFFFIILINAIITINVIVNDKDYHLSAVIIHRQPSPLVIPAVAKKKKKQSVVQRVITICIKIQTEHISAVERVHTYG